VFHAVVPVQLIAASNQVVATVLSDGSGRYTFTNVPPAEYQIRCQVPNGYRYLGVSNLVSYADVASLNGLHETRPVRLIAGQNVENADFTFAPFKKGTWKTYTKRDGLAGNEVRKILPLDDGTIWIGTMGGLSIFDGATFKNLHKEDGLPDNRILNLYHDRRGPIWICTGNGVARYDPSAPVGKRMRSYTAADGLFPGEVHAVCQTPDDVMWFAYRGISRFDGREFKTLTTTNRDAVEGHIMKMTAAPDGMIWLGGILGLGRFSPTNFTAVLEVANPAKCDSPIVRPDGTIWFVSHDAGLHRFDPSAGRNDPGRVRKFGRKDGLFRENGLTIHFMSDGTLWMGTHGVVSRFDGTNFVNFLPEDGFLGTTVIFISSTPDNVLWGGFAAYSGFYIQQSRPAWRSRCNCGPRRRPVARSIISRKRRVVANTLGRQGRFSVDAASLREIRFVAGASVGKTQLPRTR
jgi:ligand-binding sensor domain-containing protein